jgi:cell division protein FtsW (lipid II flippase)
VASAHAAGLTAVTATVTVLLAGVLHLRGRDLPTSAVAGGLVPLLLASATWAWGDVASVPPTRLAVVGLALLGALVLGLLGPEAPRAVREAAAAVAATGLALAGLDAATSAGVATWAAVYLTLCGGVVTVVSLLREDRRSLAWVGGLLLALASWVRLWDVGVRAPEAYTLPSAAVLLAVGLLRLRRVRSAGSVEALSPGLSLALVPSLLWVLVEPTGLRVLLLGLGCLALVLAGARLRWTAPLLLGAAVGALVVLRLGAPYVGDAVPRWVLLGGAGALLVTAGVTWERQLVEARRVATYVRALR